MELQKISEFMWRIPREGKMRVEGIVFASEKLMESIRQDKSLEQVANVATLPDIHWGYGFPIGEWRHGRDWLISPADLYFSEKS